MTTESCTIYLEIAYDDDLEEVAVEVDYFIEPTELEGPYTFYEGGPSFQEWRTSFTLGKLQCTEDNLEEWVEYVLGKPDDVSLDDYICDEWKRQAAGDIKTPVIQYGFQA